VRVKIVAVALALAVLSVGLATSPALAKRRPRVTVIGDSVATALDIVPAAERRLGAGLDLKLDTKVCRRLVGASCTYGGVTPKTALQVIESRGSSLGGTVVINVGYNDGASGYAADLDRVMRALKKAHVRQVIWVTLREERSTYSATNQVIRAAARRWSNILTVADWNDWSYGQSWFGHDGLHLSGAGATAFAEFLRPYVVEAVRAGADAARHTT
jgi:lysophospholipase L1-like esterase